MYVWVINNKSKIVEYAEKRNTNAIFIISGFGWKKKIVKILVI